MNGTPVAYNSLPNAAPSFGAFTSSVNDGEKFFGGFGSTRVYMNDYWTLRARSAQLFTDNHYAGGIVRRLVTNIINTGLTPEAYPDEKILGLQEGALADWSDLIESRFALWSKAPKACDWFEKHTFGKLQRAAYIEAIVSGDVLVTLRQDPNTLLPRIQLISGAAVQTPVWSEKTWRETHSVTHGVERDPQGREVAYWVRQADGDFKRMPAYGEKSGRRLAWLVFGLEGRLDDVRGMPLMATVLQSLKEIGRYRDSASRKAVVNSMVAMYIKKTQDKPGTLPIQGGATRRDALQVGNSNGDVRNFTSSALIPGMVIEELQHGEEPVFKGGDGTDVNFGTFEDAVVQSIAWSLEIPPEILKLSFSNNYSASQAAINEIKMTINMKWGDWGETFCAPVYNEWLVSEALANRIDAPGLLRAWRDPSKFDITAAWVSAEWYGSIKPSTDVVKQAKGSQLLLEMGLTTRSREARITTGMKYDKVVKRLARENQILADAMRPLLEIKQEFAGLTADGAPQATSNDEKVQAPSDELDELIAEYLGDDRS